MPRRRGCLLATVCSGLSSICGLRMQRVLHICHSICCTCAHALHLAGTQGSQQTAMPQQGSSASSFRLLVRGDAAWHQRACVGVSG